MLVVRRNWPEALAIAGFGCVRCKPSSLLGVRPLSTHNENSAIQIQNIESFRVLPAPRKEQLTIELPENFRALKITGWRHRFADLKLPESASPTGSPKGIQTSDGVARAGLFVAPPEGQIFDDVVLFLAVEETPLFSEDNSPQLIFLGGFDPTAVALNHSVDTEFLAFAYPCSDFKQLRERIGCVDLPARSMLDR